MQQINTKQENNGQIGSYKCLREQYQRRKQSSEKKQIKISRNKLPFDFFKNQTSRSNCNSPQKVSISRNLVSQRTSSIRKHPQTQRKINSYYQLQKLDISDQVPKFLLQCRNQAIKLQTDRFNILNRKIQSSTGQKHFMPNFNLGLNKLNQTNSYKQSKFRDLIDKTLITNEFLINDSMEKIIQDQIKGRKTQRNVKRQQIEPKHIEMSEMGCTFGKSFRKCSSSSLSLQNSINPMNQNPQQNVLLIQEQIQRNQNLSIKKQNQQKSTQESEINQTLKQYHQQLKNKKQRSSKFIDFGLEKMSNQKQRQQRLNNFYNKQIELSKEQKFQKNIQKKQQKTNSQQQRFRKGSDIITLPKIQKSRGLNH